MMIYLAHPIDHNTRSIDAEIDFIIEASTEAGATSVFVPGRAWHKVKRAPNSNVQPVNLMTIEHSDIVVAYWPVGTESVGIPLELAHAFAHHKPVVLIRSDGHKPISLEPHDPLMVPESDLHDRRLGDGFYRLVDTIKEAHTIAKHADAAMFTNPMLAKYDGDGQQPEAALPGDAGFDIAYHGEVDIIIKPGEKANIPSGISYQMPQGYWSLILGRSSTFSKRGLLVPPSVIDAGYTGPIFAICWNVGQTEEVIKPGDRLAQIIPMPLSAEYMNWQKSPLEQTTRGSSGFGSTGA